MDAVILPPDIRVQLGLFYATAAMYASFCGFYGFHSAWIVQLITLVVPEYWDIGADTLTFLVGVSYLPMAPQNVQLIYAAIYGTIMGIWVCEWWMESGGGALMADDMHMQWSIATFKKLAIVLAHIALMRGCGGSDIRILFSGSM